MIDPTTGYSVWENLQDAIRQIQNRIVREEFLDVSDDPNWPDGVEITTGRARLRYLCTVTDQETAEITLLKLILFYIILRKAQDLQIPVYGIPVTTFQESVEFHPQVRLYFAQDIDSVPENGTQTTAEISFRLMNESSTSLTKSELLTLANKVKTEFGASGGYRWRKGRLKVSYRDLEHGYRFILTAYSESEAREVIQKVISLRNHSPNWEYLSVSESKANFPTNTGTQMILGKPRKRPVKRPIAFVRFVYASCAIWGLRNDVILYDRTGIRANPLIS